MVPGRFGLRDRASLALLPKIMICGKVWVEEMGFLNLLQEKLGCRSLWLRKRIPQFGLKKGIPLIYSKKIGLQEPLLVN